MIEHGSLITFIRNDGTLNVGVFVVCKSSLGMSKPEGKIFWAHSRFGISFPLGSWTTVFSHNPSSYRVAVR